MMSFLRRPRDLALAGLLVLGLTFAAAENASAGSCHEPVCYWKTVTTYEHVAKPVVYYATYHKPCGTPYQVKKVKYVTVQVPVTKRVKVCS